MERKVVVTKENLLQLILLIPLVSKTNYHVIEAFAAPNASTILETPNYPVAINEKTQQYFYLTNDVKIITLSDLCQIAKATRINKFAMAKDDCIANAVLQHEQVPRCKTLLFPNSYTKFKQIARNQYLF